MLSRDMTKGWILSRIYGPMLAIARSHLNCSQQDSLDLLKSYANNIFALYCQKNEDFAKKSSETGLHRFEVVAPFP